MLRPLGIKVLSLCIQTNSLLSLSELDFGTFFGKLMYASMYMVISGSIWSLWLWKCLATVVIVIVFNVKNISETVCKVKNQHFQHQLHDICQQRQL